MLSITHKGKRNKKNLVVFIHGLTGDDSTWLNANGVSFADLLYQHKAIKAGFDMAHFTFHSKMISMNGARTLVGRIFGAEQTEINLDIPNITDLLKTELELRAAGYEEIVLIGHSLGGLISKSIILRQIEEAIAGGPRISKFISLAVPHNGSELATIAKRIFRNPQLKNLAPLDVEIYRLNDAWIKLDQHHLPETVYFQGKLDDVVKATSSVGFQQGKQSVRYFEKNHTTISKPISENDLVYLATCEVLLSVVDGQHISAELAIRSLPDESSFDDQYFVLKLILGDVHQKNIKTAKKYFYAAEFLRKVVVSKKLLTVTEFNALYSLIEGLYSTGFALYSANQLADGNSLLAYVHERIEAEDQKKLASIAQIKFMHKTGMLHQLANDPNSDIWWTDGHSIEDVENLKKQNNDSL
ncbi:MAG: hypothetical protein EOO88_07190 [Pedobacter sp.]|nr:MAG: hypothetical protein EOO88_07190 [Pedobacter sp.]